MKDMPFIRSMCHDIYPHHTMLKAIKDFFIGNGLIAFITYVAMCVGLHDTPTTIALNCTRSGAYAEPACHITENYFLGLYHVTKSFQGIKEARPLSHEESGRHGSYVIYGLAIDDAQGKGFSMADCDGEKNAAAEVKQINEYRDNPATLILHIVNDKWALIMLGFIFGFPAFITIIMIPGNIWNWYKKRKT